jgi:hypothetical protein
MCHGLLILTNSGLLFKSEISGYGNNDEGTAIGIGRKLYAYLRKEHKLDTWELREEIIDDWFEIISNNK